MPAAQDGLAPTMAMGDFRTSVTDKTDGPCYFFKQARFRDFVWTIALDYFGCLRVTMGVSLHGEQISPVVWESAVSCCIRRCCG